MWIGFIGDGCDVPTTARSQWRFLPHQLCVGMAPAQCCIGAHRAVENLEITVFDVEEGISSRWCGGEHRTQRVRRLL